MALKGDTKVCGICAKKATHRVRSHAVDPSNEREIVFETTVCGEHLEDMQRRQDRDVGQPLFRQVMRGIFSWVPTTAFASDYLVGAFEVTKL